MAEQDSVSSTFGFIFVLTVVVVFCVAAMYCCNRITDVLRDFSTPLKADCGAVDGGQDEQSKKTKTEAQRT